MRRISDFLILGIQIALGYLLVHFASPWSDLLFVRIVSFTIFIVAGFVGIKALLDLGPSFAVAPKPHEKSKFVAKGIYSKIRHPMYLAVLLAATSYLIVGLNAKSFAAFVVVATFFAVKIKYEDKVLKAKYPDYLGYSQSTGALLPKFKS